MKQIQRRKVQKVFTKPSRTQQHFKEETDVNSILERYRRTGQITHVRQGMGHYGDFTSITDYHEAMNQVIDAQERFMALPAVVRKRFANDPAQLVQFLSDDKNYDEALQLGLLSPEAVAARKTTTNQTTTKNEAAPQSLANGEKAE